jgi:hypothetical protein
MSNEKIDDIPSMPTSELVSWLWKKWARHGEIEDGVAARRLETLPGWRARAELAESKLHSYMEAKGQLHTERDELERRLKLRDDEIETQVQHRLDAQRERDEYASRLDSMRAIADERAAQLSVEIARTVGLERRLDAVTKDRDFLQVSRDSFRDAYEKAHEGERYEVRLSDHDGRLDEIVGHGRFHLEQMNTNEWFLELAGCALWINGKGVRLVPRDHNTWADLLNCTRVVERHIHNWNLDGRCECGEADTMAPATRDFLESSGIRR